MSLDGQKASPVDGGEHPTTAALADTPTDALGAFETALVAAAKAKSTDAADPAVSLAFALGWQMAELFRPHLRHREERRDGDLPGLGSLSDGEYLEISVDQIQAAVFQLTPAIQKAGLAAPTEELEAIRTALDDWDASGTAAVEALHLKLLGVLTAADFRLGKSYGLGRALADTCRKPTDAAGVLAELESHRVANLLAWLDDLSTALPPHSAHSVYTSLVRWRNLAGGSQEKLPHATIGTLRRQGSIWRSLLSAEKRGTDVLEIGNYLEAAGQVARRMNSIFWKTVWHFGWLSVLVLALVGVIVGVVMLVVGESAAVAGGSAVVGSAGTLLAALGLSWKGAGGALGSLAGKLEQPLWGAVLDAAIADAITLEPKNKSDLLGRAALASQLTTGSACASDTSPKAGSADPPDTSED